VGIIMALMVPLVAIYTSHQQKVMELQARNGALQGNSTELAMLKNEVSELKALVHEQAIALDNLASRSLPSIPSEIRERVR
jgi:hypothetical protein